ncbi:MAG: hypothetical protein ACRCXC_09710 [Legionella sp.]
MPRKVGDAYAFLSDPKTRDIWDKAHPIQYKTKSDDLESQQATKSSF